MSPPILVDYQRNGRTVKGLINVARNGYLWFLERSDGPIHFVEGKPYVKQNVFRSLDPKTGRPDVDPARKPGTGKRAEFCPGAHGGKNWPPIAFSPQTRMIYIPANNNLCGALTGVPVTYDAGKGFAGLAVRAGRFAAPGADHVGEVQAWNVDTGRAGLDARLPEQSQLGLDAGHRRRPGVQRRHERSQDPRLRRDDRQAAVGVRHRLGHRRAADDVHGRRQAVPRRARRLGRRSARHERRGLNRLFPGNIPSRRKAGFGCAVDVFAVPEAHRGLVTSRQLAHVHVTGSSSELRDQRIHLLVLQAPGARRARRAPGRAPAVVGLENPHELAS